MLAAVPQLRPAKLVPKEVEEEVEDAAAMLRSGTCRSSCHREEGEGGSGQTWKLVTHNCLHASDATCDSIADMQERQNSDTIKKN